MTDTPVGVSPSACRKARGCPGPMQTVPKPISPAPPGVGNNAPGHNVDGQGGPGYTGLDCSSSGHTIPAPKGSGSYRPHGEPEEIIVCRRKCGCMRTSDKLKQILQTFPNPQPPGAMQTYMSSKTDKASGYGYGQIERSCCDMPPAERSDSASQQVMDSCQRCILHRRRMHEAAAEVPVEPPVSKQDSCHRCMLHRRRMRQDTEMPAEMPAGMPVEMPVEVPVVVPVEPPVSRQDSCHRCMLHRRRMRQTTEMPAEMPAGMPVEMPVEVPVVVPVVVPVEPPVSQQESCHRCMLLRRQLRQAAALMPAQMPAQMPAEMLVEAPVSKQYRPKYHHAEAEAKTTSKSWQIVSELVSLVQLSVTATALALYYLIYCYMQLVYYTLRSALYFHNADGPMKITIGVVTVTSLIVGFNILMRMEGIIGIVY